MNSFQPSYAWHPFRSILALPGGCLLLCVTGLFIAFCAVLTLAASAAIFLLCQMQRLLALAMPSKLCR